jgi:hypothetical protein
VSSSRPEVEPLPPLGVIEGFYGRAWSDAERESFLEFAGREGLAFYFYAPKADAFLRRRWREEYPAESRARLERLAARAGDCGVEFGVGLSPYEAYKSWDDESTRSDLAERVRMIARAGATRLGLFFDDMQGDQNRLAELQADIAHFAAGRFGGPVVLCPTYYSDDPVLDRMFGARPERYLESMGARLDPSIDVVWTGPKICSKEYPVEHLRATSEALGRKLWLWDNYPVNDGPRMCPHLHLRAFTGRGPEQMRHLSAHAINPMNQAALSRIPILTQVHARARATTSDDDSQLDWIRAALAVLGHEGFTRRLLSDLPILQDRGWTDLTEADRRRLTDTYSAFGPSDARAEILAWIRGESQVTDRETFLSQ